MYPLLPRTRQADFAEEMSRDLKKMIELPFVFNGGFNGSLAESELKNAALRLQRLRQVPHTLEEWDPEALRQKIMEAMGVKVDHTLPLDVEYTRTIDCGTYTIRCLSYLSAPGIRGITVETGIFGADMQVEIHNDGPVTMMVEYPDPAQ